MTEVTHLCYGPGMSDGKDALLFDSLLYRAQDPEALGSYLSDPEENGIEIYADRPRDQWRFPDGNLQMRTLPLDMEDLLRQATAASAESIDRRAASLPGELLAGRGLLP